MLPQHSVKCRQSTSKHIAQATKAKTQSCPALLVIQHIEALQFPESLEFNNPWAQWRGESACPRTKFGRRTSKIFRHQVAENRWCPAGAKPCPRTGFVRSIGHSLELAIRSWNMELQNIPPRVQSQALNLVAALWKMSEASELSKVVGAARQQLLMVDIFECEPTPKMIHLWSWLAFTWNFTQVHWTKHKMRAAMRQMSHLWKLDKISQAQWTQVNTMLHLKWVELSLGMWPAGRNPASKSRAKIQRNYQFECLSMCYLMSLCDELWVD